MITEPSVLVAEFSTGVGEERAGELLVFPNPVDDVVHVRVKEGMLQRVRVLLSDGRVVIDRPIGGMTADLDLSGNAAGSFVLEAFMTDGRSERKLIFKK
ncbi:MAG: hypothetical protein IPL52_02890 [Flavobacteriales bacterium]|nr:hypothetical protein [Flavobacteriales bacterium]